MSTAGTWVQASDGRYCYDNGDGWYYDHQSRTWVFDAIPLGAAPTGAPLGAGARRMVHDITRPHAQDMGPLRFAMGPGQGWGWMVWMWLLRGAWAYCLLGVLASHPLLALHSAWGLLSGHEPAHSAPGDDAYVGDMAMVGAGIRLFLMFVLYIFMYLTELSVKDPAKSGAIRNAGNLVAVGRFLEHRIEHAVERGQR